jgi:hypothetical protein
MEDPVMAYDHELAEALNRIQDLSEENAQIRLEALEAATKFQEAMDNNAELLEALTTIAEHSDIHSDFPHSIENLQAYARAAIAKAKSPYPAAGDDPDYPN